MPAKCIPATFIISCLIFGTRRKKNLIWISNDEIIKGCLVTHNGEIFSETLKK